MSDHWGGLGARILGNLPVMTAERGGVRYLDPSEPRPDPPVRTCEWEDLTYDVDRDEPETCSDAAILMPILAADPRGWERGQRSFSLCLAHAQTVAQRRLGAAQELCRRVGVEPVGPT